MVPIGTSGRIFAPDANLVKAGSASPGDVMRS
jgi:hypothetical protein